MDIITTEAPRGEPGLIQATLIIDYGKDDIENYEIQLSNATVYSVLMKASEQYDFDLGADYQDQYQSHYIYSINSVEEGNNKFWQYYINDNYGVLGADLQVVKNNDVIKWRLQEPKL